MHGVWTADVSISTSDRRLKTNIRPLYETLQETSQHLGAPREEGAHEGSTAWTLREMRPVSYTFKKGEDAKQVRFGFIADEMEKVIPQVVDTEEKGMFDGEEIPEKKGVNYMDLVAVLTGMLKDLQQGLTALTPQLATVEERIRKRKERKAKKKQKKSTRQKEEKTV